MLPIRHRINTTEQDMILKIKELYQLMAIFSGGDDIDYSIAA